MASTDGIEEVASLTGHTSAAWGVAFHPTSPLLASCSGDKSIRLYSFTRALKGSTFQQICTLPSAHSRTIRQIAFSPDGKRMASASFDSTVGIWERTRSGGGGGASVDAGHAALSDEDDDEDDGDGDEEEWENVGSLEGERRSSMFSFLGREVLGAEFLYRPTDPFALLRHTRKQDMRAKSKRSHGAMMEPFWRHAEGTRACGSGMQARPTRTLSA